MRVLVYKQKPVIASLSLQPSFSSVTHAALVFEPLSGSWVVFFRYILPLLPEGANLQGVCLAGHLYQGMPKLFVLGALEHTLVKHMQCYSVRSTCEHGRVLNVSRLLFDAHAPAQWAVLIQDALVAPSAACNHMHAPLYHVYYSQFTSFWGDRFEKTVLRKYVLLTLSLVSVF